MKLDLGSGPKPREGFHGVDLVEAPGVYSFDLVSGRPWPFGDGEIEELSSSHFIEHVQADYVCRDAEGRPGPLGSKPWKDRLLFFFDEAFRVVRPGGFFHLRWPALQSIDAFRDPTHRRFIPLDTVHYLSREGRRALGVEQYNVNCNWILVESRIATTRRADARLWDAEELYTLWGAQREFQVVLRAEK